MSGEILLKAWRKLGFPFSGHLFSLDHGLQSRVASLGGLSKWHKGSHFVGREDNPEVAVSGDIFTCLPSAVGPQPRPFACLGLNILCEQGAGTLSAFPVWTFHGSRRQRSARADSLARGRGSGSFSSPPWPR